MRVDRSVLRGAFEQRRHRLRDARVEPGRGDAEPHALAFADRIDREHAAARDRLPGDDHQVEQQLDPVLRQQHARQVPGDLGLVILHEGARHGLRIAEIDLRTGRARGAEGEPAELQAGGRGARALLDEVEREGFGLLVVVLLLEHLEPVDDGAGRTDQVVAHPRAQERGKIEGVEGDSRGHAEVSGWTGL